MRFVLVLFTLTFLTTIAKADAFDDRAKLAEERENQVAIAKIKAQYEKGLRLHLANVASFGSKHSGYAAVPECYDVSYSLGPNSWYNTTRQECLGRFCVNVHGENPDFSRYSTAMSLSIVYFDAGITTCKVVLNNGLACEISYGDNNTFGGTCLDAGGNSRKLSVPEITR